jgi:hypothetical protein
MQLSTRGWIVLFASCGVLIVIPPIAWAVWLRRPRVRPIPVIALATTAPLATALVGAARGVIVFRSLAREDAAPGEKARLLAETISSAMNDTVVAVLGAAVVCGIAGAASLWRGRRGRR